MFAQEDFKEYFADTEKKLSELLTLYTDLLNELDNRSVRSKISSITTETLETYRFIKQQRNEFLKEIK